MLARRYGVRFSFSLSVVLLYPLLAVWSRTSTEVSSMRSLRTRLTLARLNLGVTSLTRRSRTFQDEAVSPTSRCTSTGPTSGFSFKASALRTRRHRRHSCVHRACQPPPRRPPSLAFRNLVVRGLGRAFLCLSVCLNFASSARAAPAAALFSPRC